MKKKVKSRLRTDTEYGVEKDTCRKDLYAYENVLGVYVLIEFESEVLRANKRPRGQ